MHSTVRYGIEIFGKRFAKIGHEQTGINRNIASAHDKLFYPAKSAVKIFNQGEIEKCANTPFRY